MPAYDLLHIYDESTNALMRFDFSLRNADYVLAVGATRTQETTEKVKLPVFGEATLPRTWDLGGVDALLKGLDSLVISRSTFRRVVVSTHGFRGTIWIGDEPITATVLNTRFRARGYDRLFPHFARMYFCGCNVAEGDEGWQFLAAAGAVFLRTKGGVAFAWTSAGLAIPYHTEHVWGDTKYVTIAPGGTVSDRYTGAEKFKREHPNSWMFR